MLFRAALQPLLGVWIASLVFLVTHTPVYRFRRLDRATLVQAANVFGAGVVLGIGVPVRRLDGGDAGAPVDRHRRPAGGAGGVKAR